MDYAPEIVLGLFNAVITLGVLSVKREIAHLREVIDLKLGEHGRRLDRVERVERS